MTRLGKAVAALIAGVSILFGAGSLPSWGAPTAPVAITVYKSPACT